MAVVYVAVCCLYHRDLTQYSLPNGELLDVRNVRFYATMNPASVGGGRSQLPRSLRSLFTAVQVAKPSDTEVRDIALDLFDNCLDKQLLDEAHVNCLLNFHRAVITAAERRDLGRGGAPAEFNMRDLIKVNYSERVGCLLSAQQGLFCVFCEMWCECCSNHCLSTHLMTSCQRVLSELEGVHPALILLPEMPVGHVLDRPDRESLA